MSKFVKDLVTNHLKSRLQGANDALLMNIVGLDAGATSKLRQELRKKKIQMTLVKNSLARRATEGTALAPAFEGAKGTLAVLWGGEDIVSLSKEVARLMELKEFAKFEARGGAMDGSKMAADDIKLVAKWPSRTEQLSLLLGQILSPGATLVGQLTSVGGALASQISQKAEGEEASAEAPAGDAVSADVPPAGDAPAAEAPAAPA